MGGDFLLSSDGSGSISVFTLLTLLVYFSILRRYVCRDDQDLAIWGLKLFSWIVRGDRCVGDLERKAIRRRFLVHPATVGRSKGSTKFLEDTTLACGVFGLLVDRAWFIEVIPAASTILIVESRFDLDLAFHVA
jgi:hypothetical protein